MKKQYKDWEQFENKVAERFRNLGFIVIQNIYLGLEISSQIDMVAISERVSFV